jgi:uncharacterized membrane protein YheB (UPF0754 family)
MKCNRCGNEFTGDSANFTICDSCKKYDNTADHIRQLEEQNKQMADDKGTLSMSISDLMTKCEKAWDRINEREIQILVLLEKNKKLLDAIMSLDVDNHYWSNRPCPTCQLITDLIEQPFGCNKYALRKITGKKPEV